MLVFYILGTPLPFEENPLQISGILLFGISLSSDLRLSNSSADPCALIADLVQGKSMPQCLKNTGGSSVPIKEICG
jgi:hypothetical protein